MLEYAFLFQLAIFEIIQPPEWSVNSEFIGLVTSIGGRL